MDMTVFQTQRKEKKMIYFDYADTNSTVILFGAQWANFNLGFQTNWMMIDQVEHPKKESVN